jgi:hypothetical protein
VATTAHRPAVDVGPKQGRSGVALLLAILAIPGSTIAWDLPAGGLWIGLPLAVAAIVLARRRRREAGPSPITTAAIVIASLVLAQMVVYSVVMAVS